MKRLRGAIVGFGNVAAGAHVPGFARAPGFRIAAVVDPSESRRDAAHALLSDASLASSLDELDASRTPIDFVDVATPPHLHAELATQALERGWHVLCEKPLAVAESDVAAIAAAARRSGKTVFTVHNWKYAPLFQRLRGLLVRGAIGRPLELEWTVLRPNPPEGATAEGRSWRTERAVAGGGILVDHGWHAVYLAMFVLGAVPRAVSGRVWNERPGALEVEDSAEVRLDFGGPVARLFFTWAATERKTGGMLKGTDGEIEIRDDALTIRRLGRAEETVAFSPSLAASSVHPEWFPALLEDFRQEILHLDRRGRNLGEALLCADVLAAAYASNGETRALAREALT